MYHIVLLCVCLRTLNMSRFSKFYRLFIHAPNTETTDAKYEQIRFVIGFCAGFFATAHATKPNCYRYKDTITLEDSVNNKLLMRGTASFVVGACFGTGYGLMPILFSGPLIIGIPILAAVHGFDKLHHHITTKYQVKLIKKY